jgi:N-methylhydantoinase B
VVVAMPVFFDRKPVLLPAVRAHMGDVGGRRRLQFDGLVMPPVKIVSRG